MGAKQVREYCKLDAESCGYLEYAMEEMDFSARAHDRILRVSRTLADLAAKKDITGNEILEAIQLRSLDRRLFEWNEARTHDHYAPHLALRGKQVRRVWEHHHSQ